MGRGVYRWHHTGRTQSDLSETGMCASGMYTGRTIPVARSCDWYVRDRYAIRALFAWRSLVLASETLINGI